MPSGAAPDMPNERWAAPAGGACFAPPILGALGAGAFESCREAGPGSRPTLKQYRDRAFATFRAALPAEGRADRPAAAAAPALSDAPRGV
jgi:hypothetical protein